MSINVRLAEPQANPLKVSADGGLDVIVHVTHEEMESGWSVLQRLMKEDPSARMREWTKDGRTEKELRLLCGLFSAVSGDIPMSPSNLIEWVSLLDPDDVDGFVIWRMKQLDDFAFEDVLNDRDLSALGLERVSEPISRGPGLSPRRALEKALPKLNRHEIAETIYNGLGHEEACEVLEALEGLKYA